MDSVMDARAILKIEDNLENEFCIIEAVPDAKQFVLILNCSMILNCCGNPVHLK
jgi:hypothetical protein